MEPEVIILEDEDEVVTFKEVVLEHDVHILQEINEALIVRCAELAQINDNSTSQLESQQEQIEHLKLEIVALEQKFQQNSPNNGEGDTEMTELKTEEVDLSPLMITPEDEIFLDDEEVITPIMIPLQQATESINSGVKCELVSSTISNIVAKPLNRQTEAEVKPEVTITLCNVLDEDEDIQPKLASVKPLSLPSQARNIHPDVIEIPGGATLHIV